MFAHLPPFTSSASQTVKLLPLSADLQLLRGSRGSGRPPGWLPRLQPPRTASQSHSKGLVSPCRAGMGFAFGSLDQIETSLVGSFILDFGINWLAWAVAVIFQTEKFYDLVGSISFITVGLFSLIHPSHFHARQIGVTTMVLLWTIRLGAFLFVRTMITGGDSRFEEVKKNPGMFFVFWTMQAVWVWVCCLPLILENASMRNPGLNWSDVLGIVMYTTGFLVEAIADFQKFAFKMNPENKGRFVDVGLWKYARYPQYFGENLLWWGIFATAAAGLHGWEFVAVASPLLVMLLTLYISGIPIQEKQAKERWGDDPEYIDYRKKTNFLVPLPKIGNLSL